MRFNPCKGRRKAGERNKLEAAYEQHLELRRRAGEVAWYRYEGIKFRLADKTFLTPDFAVMLADGTMEIHETKGYMMDDAAVKLKVAADQYPFRFLLIRQRAKRDGGGWDIQEV